MEEIQKFLEKIEWLRSSHPYGGACIRIMDGKTIYVDPSQISPEQMNYKADIILITHSHDDHFSMKTISNLIKSDTIIISPDDVNEKLSENDDKLNVFILKASESKLIGDIKITAIPAYSNSAHPRSSSWIGYIIEIEGHKIYHSGDSGLIEEMKVLNDIDIAFLTIRHPYMMSAKEIVEAVKIIQPKICVPIHWIEEERSEIDYIIKNCPRSTKLCILEMI
ncbi:MAG: MBL fold metallo-hydrolase [Candidatus Lokiarchaeota archaeon]|nr:MBL fold metallo-hydrolase [Candidatus Lokiarchaeota archaeon]